MPKINQIITPQRFRTGVAVLGTLGVGAAGAFDPTVFDDMGSTNSIVSLVLGGIYVLLKLFNGEKNAK